MEGLENEPFCTSQTVINELLYLAVAKYYRDRGLAKGKWSLRQVLARHEYPGTILKAILGLLDDLEVEVLPEPQDYRELVRVAVQYPCFQAMQQ